MHVKEAIERGIEKVGLTALAERMNESPQAVANWRSRAGVPVDRCADFERATDFASRRWDLRPDDWHRIWPELIGTEGAPPLQREIAEVRDAA